MEDAKLIALHQQMSEAGPKGGRGGLGVGGSRRGQPYNFAGAKAYGESEIQTAAPLPPSMPQQPKAKGTFRSSEPTGKLAMIRFNLVKFVREGEGPGGVVGMKPTLNTRTRLTSSDESDNSDDSSDSSDSSSSDSDSDDSSDDDEGGDNAEALRAQSAKAAEEAREAALAWKPKANLPPPKQKKKEKKEKRKQKDSKKRKREGDTPMQVWKWKMEIKMVVKNDQRDTLTVRDVTKSVMRRFKVFCATPAGASVRAVAALGKSELKKFVKGKIASASFLDVSKGEFVKIKGSGKTNKTEQKKMKMKKKKKKQKTSSIPQIVEKEVQAEVEKKKAEKEEKEKETKEEEEEKNQKKKHKQKIYTVKYL
jgi:hypothetical protein